jgi:hypothetical protein
MTLYNFQCSPRAGLTVLYCEGVPEPWYVPSGGFFVEIKISQLKSDCAVLTVQRISPEGLARRSEQERQARTAGTEAEPPQ